jgi:hypothetical protein
MKSYQLDDLIITLDKKAAHEYSKVSYPLRYGRFAEVRTSEYIYQFNLNGEIKFISGLGKNWPDPSEWLKRTAANDWVYYSTGGYSGVYDLFGEYYLPCLPYRSNSINMRDPFEDDAVKTALNTWYGLHQKMRDLCSHSLPRSIRSFFDQVVEMSPEFLRKRSQHLHEIIQGPITVLPPDVRHVDYEAIPIIVADGCLYKCDFCAVKSKQDFRKRSQENILCQIKDLKAFYDRDIRNYNSIFLAQHDALHAGIDLLEFTARHAYEDFEFKRSNIKESRLFLFGSVDSIIKSDHNVFDRLDALPFLTYINIGLESADSLTLNKLGKGITSEAVDDTFARILEINKRYERIEITSNFVFGNGLPMGHIPSFYRLIEKRVDHVLSKGAVYFSPLMNGRRREKGGIKREFYKLKIRSRLPTFLYLIQRL